MSAEPVLYAAAWNYRCAPDIPRPAGPEAFESKKKTSHPNHTVCIEVRITQATERGDQNTSTSDAMLARPDIARTALTSALLSPTT